MPSSNHELNFLQTVEVARALGDLIGEVVFVGGCTTALLVDDAAVHFVRRTEDVDIIVDIMSRTDLNVFGEKLQERGFNEDMEDDAIVCRWVIPYLNGKLKVDIMPTDPSLLGFSNRWYSDAIEYAQPYKLTDTLTIQLVNSTYFLATKFEAFHGRGEGDYFSHDLEDIIYLLEHRSGLAIELMDSNPDVKRYLSDEASALLNAGFKNVLPGLLSDSAAANNVISTLKLMKKMLG